MFDFDGSKPKFVALSLRLIHAFTLFITLLAPLGVDGVVDTGAEERPLEGHPIFIWVCKNNTVELFTVDLVAMALEQSVDLDNLLGLRSILDSHPFLSAGGKTYEYIVDGRKIKGVVI